MPEINQHNAEKGKDKYLDKNIRRLKAWRKREKKKEEMEKEKSKSKVGTHSIRQKFCYQMTLGLISLLDFIRVTGY